MSVLEMSGMQLYVRLLLDEAIGHDEEESVGDETNLTRDQAMTLLHPIGAYDFPKTMSAAGVEALKKAVATVLAREKVGSADMSELYFCLNHCMLEATTKYKRWTTWYYRFGMYGGEICPQVGPFDRAFLHEAVGPEPRLADRPLFQPWAELVAYIRLVHNVPKMPPEFANADRANRHLIQKSMHFVQQVDWSLGQIGMSIWGAIKFEEKALYRERMRNPFLTPEMEEVMRREALWSWLQLLPETGRILKRGKTPSQILDHAYSGYIDPSPDWGTQLPFEWQCPTS
ncbi:hypothetical protein M011DRAFT_224899 [Sporormia fimetaria CBS 119925]|uniref:Uncharacterized protein n=1 Tax=Sporormia fimetaria CBS 119925 TaxID=1340428 RepID=A0A6A6V013_9PLEO|nr:hypothetical protein M011DRAFT_224899 [Sporormia fimetaria CBS 119925]